MIHQAFSYPLILIDWHFVPHTHTDPIPTTARVGQIKDLGEIHIEIRLTYDSYVVIIVRLPQVLAIIFTSRCTMHADGFHRIELSEMSQLHFEMAKGFFRIAFTNRHVFIMIADLMTKSDNLFDNTRLVALWNHTEIIRRLNFQSMFDLRGS